MVDTQGDAQGDRRPLVVTVFNQKGGIGKTTTTVNLAVALAAMGQRVALVDLDSQSNATSSLGMTAPPAAGSYRLVVGGGRIGDTMVATPFAGLWLCAATDELVGADIELALAENPQIRLRQSILDEPTDLDFVLIDCPPALGMLPVNALVASDLAVLPVSPEPLAREGLLKAWRHIHRIKANLNPSLYVLGVLLTMVDKMVVHREFAATVRAEFGSRVLPVSIPRDPVILAASAQEMPVVVFDPESAAAKAYLQLAHLLLLAGRHRREGRPEDTPDLPEWLRAQSQRPDHGTLAPLLLRWREEVARDLPASVHALHEPQADEPEPRAKPASGGGGWLLAGLLIGAILGTAAGVNMPAIVEFVGMLVPR